MVPPVFSKTPVTLVIIMWRAVKPVTVWAGSIAHTSADAGEAALRAKAMASMRSVCLMNGPSDVGLAVHCPLGPGRAESSSHAAQALLDARPSAGHDHGQCAPSTRGSGI